MSARASQITSIVCSTAGSFADQRKLQSSGSLAFVRRIHQWPLNSPHKGPVTRNMFPWDDVTCYPWPFADEIMVTLWNSSQTCLYKFVKIQFLIIDIFLNINFACPKDQTITSPSEIRKKKHLRRVRLFKISKGIEWQTPNSKWLTNHMQLCSKSFWQPYDSLKWNPSLPETKRWDKPSVRYHWINGQFYDWQDYFPCRTAKFGIGTEWQTVW